MDSCDSTGRSMICGAEQEMYMAQLSVALPLSASV